MFGDLEKRATSAIYVAPIATATLAGFPIGILALMATSPGTPLQAYFIPLPILAVIGGVATYLFLKLQRYRRATAALRVWAKARGFAAQDRAYAGIVAGRRCAALSIYRREGRTEYAFRGFALLVELTSYSTGAFHVYQRPRTQDEALRLLDFGFDAALRGIPNCRDGIR
jgi:hypothetical protein